ncbi:MAG: hypothetical protein J0I06_06465 [Planctomycetes bacterium]|nr:hypothetical protein [Planctomycetota bacterium]
MPRARFCFCAPWLLVGLLAAVGCSSPPPVGTVSGKVVRKGEPVTTGSANLYLKAKGIGATAPLDAAGRFTIPDPIEVGIYDVYISPPQSPGTGIAVAKGGTPVPTKYWQAETSGLTAEVKAGANELLIELKD